MSATAFFAIVAGVFVAWGLVMAWLAGIMGKPRFGWWLLGTTLGPLSLAAFIGSLRRPRRQVRAS